MSSTEARRRPIILFTTERSAVRDIYFPLPVIESLEQLGDVIYNDGPDPFTSAQLADLIPGVDVCLTHWSTPRFDAEVLARADRLALIAHAGGSVADLVSPEVFERGIVVTSVSGLMARHVAEGVLTYILADLHRVVERAQLLRDGGWLDPPARQTASLSSQTVGLVGLGLVGRRLIRLLHPFGVRVIVFDPYVDEAEIVEMGAEPASLDDLLGIADVISLHASLTADTRGLLSRDKLALVRSGALIVNTARGALIDETALVDELRSGRIRAVLDVFEREPLPADDALRALENATLMPHSAGSSSGADLAATSVEEIARFARSAAPMHPVSFERFTLMTTEDEQHD